MQRQAIALTRLRILSEKNLESSIINRLVKQGPSGCVVAVGLNLIYPARGLLPVSDIKQYALEETCTALASAGINFTQHVNSELSLLQVDRSNAHEVKRVCCDVEEGNRLLDIDVYNVNGCVTRLDIGLSERACFLCNKTASWCIFNQTHSAEDLFSYTLAEYKKMISAYEK